MKSKLFKIIISILMIFVSMPQSIFADETDWSLLQKALVDETQTSVDGLFEVANEEGVRKVKLLSDIVAQDGDATIKIQRDERYSVELDLNGFTINGNNKIQKELFKIGKFENSNYNELTINDNSPGKTGVIKNGIEQIFYIDEYGFMTLNGGTITNDYPLSENAIFLYKYPHEYYGAGTFIMNGGIITGISSNCQIIYNNGGIIVMTGGEISNNHCEQFGTIDNVGMMLMLGGEISSNTVTSGLSGGIYNNAFDKKTLIIGGDSICKNNKIANDKISNIIINKGYSNLHFMPDDVLLSDLVGYYFPDSYKESFDKLNIETSSKAPCDGFDISFGLYNENNELTYGTIATDVDYDLFKYLKYDNPDYYFRYVPEQNSNGVIPSHFDIVEIKTEKKIEIAPCNHGSIYAYSYYEKPEETVSIYYNVEDGYVLDSLSYEEKNSNNSVAIEDCSFEMPHNDIIIKAIFKVPNVPSPAPSDKPAKKYSVPNTGVYFFN